ncbi:hypothetical protein [uncultured Clostridium sp.]|uniref:hypothetical protein n=1 Tax=uncultured Clostridium sp. TaxID=59620 RepID=UPI0028ECD81A|nr:hypothetical protein [uncultured Clostridium sp.]
MGLIIQYNQYTMENPYPIYELEKIFAIVIDNVPKSKVLNNEIIKNCKCVIGSFKDGSPLKYILI